MQVLLSYIGYVLAISPLDVICMQLELVRWRSLYGLGPLIYWNGLSSQATAPKVQLRNLNCNKRGDERRRRGRYNLYANCVHERNDNGRRTNEPGVASTVCKQCYVKQAQCNINIARPLRAGECNAPVDDKLEEEQNGWLAGWL